MSGTKRHNGLSKKSVKRTNKRVLGEEEELTAGKQDERMEQQRKRRCNIIQSLSPADQDDVQAMDTDIQSSLPSSSMEDPTPAPAPGEEGYGISHEGGEYEVFQDLTEDIERISGFKRYDDRTRGDRIERATEAWASQMQLLIAAYLRYCTSDEGEGFPKANNAHAGSTVFEIECIDVFSKKNVSILVLSSDQHISHHIRIYSLLIRILQAPLTGGRQALELLVKCSRDEYNALTEEERQAIVARFEEQKSAIATGRRPSARSRVNDITHTLQAVETELGNLRARTGSEHILLTVPGGTNLPVRSAIYATEGVMNFLEDVIRMDSHEFLSKMEGFAVQGVRGASKSHKLQVSETRTMIRAEILRQLKEESGDQNAVMHWKNYWSNIVQRYSLVIDGWPANVPFDNLSTRSPSLAVLQSLLRGWQSGEIRWKAVTPEELKVLQAERDAKIQRGEIEVPPGRKGRADAGIPRGPREKGIRGPTRRNQSKFSSPEEVPDSDEEGGEERTGRSPSGSPASTVAEPMPPAPPPSLPLAPPVLTRPAVQNLLDPNLDPTLALVGTDGGNWVHM